MDLQSQPIVTTKTVDSEKSATTQEVGSMYPLSQISKQKLRWLNRVAAFAHFALGLSFAIVTAVYWGEGKSFKGINTATYVAVPNFVPKPVADPVGGSESTQRYKIGSVDSKVVTENNSYVIPVLIVLFSWLTASFHLAVSSTSSIKFNGKQLQLGRKQDYERQLDNGINTYRWIEYSITASVMLAIVTFSLGLRDFTGLLGILFANFLIMLTGASVEYFNAQKMKSAAWGLTIAAWLAYAAVWGCIWYSFIKTIDSLKVARSNSFLNEEQKKDLDDFEIFVYFGTITIFFLFTCFGFVQLKQTYKNKQYESGTVNVAKYERTYIYLSLASKTSLVALLFYGLYGRSANN